MMRDPPWFIVAVCAANSLAFIIPNTSPFVVGALVDWSTTVGDGRKVTDSNGQSSATYTLPATWTGASGSITVTVTGTSLSATFVFFAIP